jgi:hypothetical protein
MRDLFILIVHFITTFIRLAKPGGLWAVVAESVLAKHQLLILNRSRQRAPNLRIRDRLTAGLCSLWIKPSRFQRVAILFKPSSSPRCRILSEVDYITCRAVTQIYGVGYFQRRPSRPKVPNSIVQKWPAEAVHR